MSTLKKILVALGIIILIPLIIAIFLPKEYSVFREIIISKPNKEVFDYVKFLKNQDNFSKWAQMDPKMTKSYSGKDGTVGFISAWESKVENVGVGEQEIIKITEGKRVDFELRFKEPFEAKDYAYIITESISENETRVTWGFDGKMQYPFNLMLLFMDFDQMLGDDLEVGLKGLQNVLNKSQIETIESTPIVSDSLQI